MKNYDTLYTDFLDLDRAKKNAKFYISYENRNYIVTDNSNGEKLAFNSQIMAINWIKKQPN